MGPVDAQVYLEDMSWNKGWILFYFVVSTLKRNIRIFLYIRKKIRIFGSLK